MTQQVILPSVGASSPAVSSKRGVGGAPPSHRPKGERNREDTVIRAVSAFSLLAIWIVGSLLLPASVLPGPIAVVEQLWENIQSGILWPNMLTTFGRVVGAFALAMVVASTLGILMGVFVRVEKFFDTWLIVGMTMPALVTIIIVFMLVGLNEQGTIVAAALPTIAMLTINVWEGIRSVDTKLISMARAFRVPRSVIIRSAVIPQVAPTLMASARFGLGLVWKMILFIELLGRSDGVGYQIEFNYRLFNMPQVLAWALSFLVVMLIIEIGIFGFIEKKLFHWRPKVHQA